MVFRQIRSFINEAMTAKLARFSFAAGMLLLSLSACLWAQTKRLRATSEHLFFRAKMVINPGTGRTISNAIVETNGGKILQVGTVKEISIPRDAKVIDWSEKYVIPGLVDTHGHLYGRLTGSWQTTDALLPIFYLAAGVTSVGDPGSMDPGGDLALRNRIDSGQYTGPRYFLAGEYIDMPPLIVGWMNPSATAEEARLKIDHWSSMGATATKIYADSSGDIMQAAIDQSHEHGMRVWAHVGAVTYQQAMDMGVDQLFHGVLAMADTRPPGISQKDYVAWGQETAQLDLNRPEIQQVFQTAAARKVVLTPTAVVSEIFEPSDRQRHYLDRQQKYFTAKGWERIEKIIAGPPPQGFSAEGISSEVKKNEEFIRQAHDAGCILSTGTDYVFLSILPGWSLWREMDIFFEAGLAPMDILKAATWNGIYAIGRTDQLGSVEAGKLADFVALDGNPLSMIANVHHVYRVVKGGVIYDPEELLKPLVGRVE
jgi:Imidazolonepropionase and related amidohydrolases